jgi:hypothetical protein
MVTAVINLTKMATSNEKDFTDRLPSLLHTVGDQESLLVTMETTA